MSSASSSHHNHNHNHSHHDHSSHSHSHSDSATSTGGKKAPCDYCSAIKAHGAHRKAEQRAAEHNAKKKQQQQHHDHQDCSSCNEGSHDEEEEEDYDDPDDPDKLVLPAQRVALPLDTRILTAVTVGFVLLSLKMVKNILAAKYA